MEHRYGLNYNHSIKSLGLKLNNVEARNAFITILTFSISGMKKSKAKNEQLWLVLLNWMLSWKSQVSSHSNSCEGLSVHRCTAAAAAAAACKHSNIIQDSHLEKSRQLECQFTYALSLSLSLSLSIFLPPLSPSSNSTLRTLNHFTASHACTLQASLTLTHTYKHAHALTLTHVKVVVGVFIWSVEKSANQKFRCIRTYSRCAHTHARRSQVSLKTFFVAVVHKLWRKKTLSLGCCTKWVNLLQA